MMHKLARVEYQPLGVLGAIIPWYSLYMHEHEGYLRQCCVTLIWTVGYVLFDEKSDSLPIMFGDIVSYAGTTPFTTCLDPSFPPCFQAMPLSSRCPSTPAGTPMTRLDHTIEDYSKYFNIFRASNRNNI